MVRNAQALCRAGPYDCRSCTAPAVLCDGQSQRLGKSARRETGSGGVLELHAGTLGRWAQPSDCACSRQNAAYPRVTRRGQTVLGANAFRDGAEDAPHYPRPVGARLEKCRSKPERVHQRRRKQRRNESQFCLCCCSVVARSVNGRDIKDLKPHNFWMAVSLCFRFSSSGPWAWSKGPAIGLDGSYTQFSYTHNP